MITQPLTVPSFIKLFQPELQHPSEVGGRSAEQWTLSQFFEQHFVPNVLQAERNVDKDTIGLYRNAIDYWKQLTSDPPLAHITRDTIAKFQVGLREVKFQRSSRKGAKQYSLRPFTQAKHLKNVRAILFRAGPDNDAKRPATGLLDKAPHIVIRRPKLKKPKPRFTLEQARRIVAAADQMRKPRIKGIPSPAWWRAFLCTLFYTGQRVGTVLQLRWSMLGEDELGPLLEIPGEIVDKTDKQIEVSLHPEALAALQAIRCGGDLMLPFKHSYTHLDDLHNLVQAKAGIEAQKRLTIHAWRRTYTRQMIALGLSLSRKIGRLALDHEDERTASDHYCSMENELRLKLPWLLPAVDPRQPLLF